MINHGMNNMQNSFESVLSRLSLEQIDTYLYRWQGNNAGIVRIYGGQVIAQAYIAACATVEDDSAPHSLHAYFIRPGVLKQPVLYSVDPIRNGKSFHTRTVKAIQNNEVIFTMTISFQQEIFLKEREYSIKWVEWNDVFDPKKMPPIRNIWLKPNGKIPGDSIFHHAFLSYVSDSGLLVPCMYPHGLSFMSPNLKMIASLDHAMWFQKRDFKWDDWILYSTDSPHTGGSRGLGRGTFFTRDGEIIASTIQEGLFRVKGS